MVLNEGIESLNYAQTVTSSDIETLLVEIRKRVAQRRLAGDYPPGLEQELEAEFRGVVDRERRDWYATTRRLEAQEQAVMNALARLDGLTGTQSRVPGGSLVHRLVRRLIGRQVLGLAAQVRSVGDETVALLRMVVELQKAQEDADRRLVAHLAKSTVDRLAVVDHLAMMLTDFEKRFDAQFPR